MKILAKLAAWWRGDYIWTASGGRFYPLRPRLDEIFIRDIACGLANEDRYNGQYDPDSGYFFYSVAEHSVIVSVCAERAALKLGLPPDVARAWGLEGLLHDAAEAYIGDVCRPLKYGWRFWGYRRMEKRLERAIAERFGLMPSTVSARAVKDIDNRVIADEVAALIRLPEGDSVDDIEPLETNIAGLSPRLARHVFLQRFEELTGGVLA